MESLAGLFNDELSVLSADRRAHSLAVGRKAVSAASYVDSSVRGDLVTAATLHDIGYAYPVTGFHPFDGAAYLERNGYSTAVVNLVVMHSASRLEAEERGLDLGVYDRYAIDRDLRAAHSVIWWADMTTGPQGQDVRVDERLEEISGRYGPSDVVTRFVERARSVLLAAGQSPTGSIQTLS